MANQDNGSLQIGDTVIYNTFGTGAAASATGVILNQLGDGRWRVKWSNRETPMRHRDHSLKRSVNATSSDAA
jgi:hypothetical protein